MAAASSADHASATFVLHTQAANAETMASAREIMKKYKSSGWQEFAHRKSSAGTSTCIYVMEEDEAKRRDVFAFLTGALMSMEGPNFKWILTWTTQHRASDIIEFHSAK